MKFLVLLLSILDLSACHSLAFFLIGCCMSEWYYKRVELYLWGVAINFSGSGDTAVCHPLPGHETQGKCSSAIEAQAPMAGDAIIVCYHCTCTGCQY